MRKILFALILVTMAVSIHAQDTDTTGSTNALPPVELRNLDGEVIDMSLLGNDGKPIIICFWATWCKPCLQELIAISEVYGDWQEETGVLLVAVSIDDAKSTARVPAVVNGRNWDYLVLLDPNQDFKRAMGVNNPPHTFILDGSGNLVWQHTGYMQGDEEEYYEVVMKIVNGEETAE